MWGLTTLHRKKNHVTNSLQEPRTWMDCLVKRQERQTMHMRFGTCNIRSFYTAGSLVTVSRDLLKYKLDLVGVKEVR
jgi:hypothetical protein